jgi:hypothetical protein
MTISWAMPGPSAAELRGRYNLLVLPYLFWLVGTLTLLLLRPFDTRWRLLIAFSYLTAIWLMAGLVSQTAIWHSAIVMRMAIWLCVPIYWHLHWVFPQPLRRLPNWMWPTVYLIATALAAAE